MDKKAGKAWSHPHYLHEEKADAGAGIEHAGWQNRSNQPVVLELLQAPPLHLPLSPLISAPVPLFCALCTRPHPTPSPAITILHAATKYRAKQRVTKVCRKIDDERQ